MKYVNIAVLIFCFFFIDLRCDKWSQRLHLTCRYAHKNTKISLVISVIKINRGAAGSNKIFFLLLKIHAAKIKNIYKKRRHSVFPAIKIDSFYCISLCISRHSDIFLVFLNPSRGYRLLSCYICNEYVYFSLIFNMNHVNVC